VNRAADFRIGQSLNGAVLGLTFDERRAVVFNPERYHFCRSPRESTLGGIPGRFVTRPLHPRDCHARWAVYWETGEGLELLAIKRCHERLIETCNYRGFSYSTEPEWVATSYLGRANAGGLRAEDRGAA
jgi:hypothetical protein